MNARKVRIATCAAALGAAPAVAHAHDFSWFPTFVSVVALLQAIPLLWFMRWGLKRLAIWHVVALIASWPIGIGASMRFNHIWPMLVLLVPWAYFGVVAVLRARELQHAP